MKNLSFKKTVKNCSFYVGSRFGALAAALAVALIGASAQATVAEVWCSPDGLSTAAYTEVDPGALDANVINKIDQGTVASPSVIHLKPGTYEISGVQGTALFDWIMKKNAFEIVGDVDDPGKVVLKGMGMTPQSDGTVVTNTYVFGIGRTGDYARIRGLTFTNFLCSDSIINLSDRYAKYQTKYVVEDCVFTGNFGPGSAVRGETVKNCTFRGNTNAANASLVANANVWGCRFEENAGVSGVAVKECEVSNTVFKANVAMTNGIAWWERKQNCIIDSCLFESNKALKGGAIWVGQYTYATETFRNCRFIGNSAMDSSGAVLAEGSPSFYDCAFVGNSAATNSAVGNASAFANCVFTNNYAGVDGGVCAYYSSVVISNCVFVGNGAGRNYGVGYLFAGSISNVVFENNFALTNSTIDARSASKMTAYNAVFVGNVSTNFLAGVSLANSLVVSNRCESGGYLFNNGQPVNCTIVHNKGIAHASGGGSINSILVGNEPYDINRLGYAKNFYNVIYGTTDGGTQSPVTDCQQVDGVAKVGFLMKDDERQPFWGLKKGSIARDAGNSEKVPAGLAFDLAGNGRVNGTSVDVGCYEWWPSTQGLMILIR